MIRIKLYIISLSLLLIAMIMINLIHPVYALNTWFYENHHVDTSMKYIPGSNVDNMIDPYSLVGAKLPAVKILREGTIYKLYGLISGICRCKTTILGVSTIIEGSYIGVNYRVLKGKNGLAVVGDNGYVYFRLGDGKSYKIKSYNELFSNATDDLYNLIGDVCRYFDIIGSDYKLVYYGVSGEEVSEKIIGVEIHPNGTTKTLNKRIREYVNPYDVYYIYIAGYRVEPAIIIRGVDPFEIPYDTMAQYLKAFTPVAEQYKKIEITRSMIDKMIKIYTSETGSKPSDVYIYDIYLTLSRDSNYLLPTLKVKAVNSSVVYWFQITWNSDIVVLGNAVFSGTSVSPDHYSLMEGDEILDNLKITDIYVRESSNGISYAKIIPIIVLILILGIAISTVLIIKRYYNK